MATKPKKTAKANAGSSDDATAWKHMLPPSARTPAYARDFTHQQEQDLRRLGCSTKQITRLRATLRVIALYTTAAPQLADVRKIIGDLADKLTAAQKALRALTAAPESDSARMEALLRITQSAIALFPDRGFAASHGQAWITAHSPRDDAAWLVREIDSLVAIATRAHQATPHTATKTPAHPYPIQCIHLALRLGFLATPLQPREPIPPTASPSSPFYKITTICYVAANAPSTNPTRAIRAYMASS